MLAWCNTQYESGWWFSLDSKDQGASDFGYILKVGLTEFTKRWDMKDENQGGLQVFFSEQLDEQNFCY